MNQKYQDAKRFTVTLSGENWEWLQCRANRVNRPASETMNQILDTVRKEEGAVPSPPGKLLPG